MQARYIPLIFIFLFPLYAVGQNKGYDLYGRVNANSGETLPYHLVFDVKGNKLTGYSVTTWPNGQKYNTQVTGNINRKNHTLRVTELKPLLAQQKDSFVLCLFDATLSYKLMGSKYLVTGPFTGTDVVGNKCGDGTMTFEQLNSPGSIFNREKKELPPPPKTQADTPVKREPIPANTITEGVQKQIDWNTDICILEIWDGGVIDGDIVTVLFNDKPVLTNYTLEKAHKQLRIPLANKTINTITIIADDEGANPPNTTNIGLTDGGTSYNITAYNNKGKKATIILFKK